MATGEVRAATRDQRRGFYWQDWYAAWVMLKALSQPEGITHIEVEAAGADGVDDVILHFRDRVSARQLKRRKGEVFTGSDIFGSPEDKPSVIAKLFAGWKKLSEEHPSVEVRLVTNARASDDPQNRPISPQGFVDRILKPLRAESPLAAGDEATLEDIRRRASAPDATEFRRFLGALHCDFEELDEVALQAECVGLLRDIGCTSGSGIRDASAFQAWVYDVATQSKARLLSLNEIEQALRRHLELPLPSSEHRIALPEHHIERPEVVDSILTRARAMLEMSKGGYLRVLGPPGCGKTTLATWIADHHDEDVLVRYHVFDPNRASASTVADRATKLTFVRTLLDVLRSRFPDDVGLQVPTPDTAQEAAEALGPQLTRLAAGGARLVIVDGIDHIIRAGLDRGSFLDALPQPPPPGVVFVLFGQPEWRYPDWLERCPSIPVPPFEPEETLRHLCAQLGWTRTDPAAAAVGDQLHQKTEGNPLSIFYNIAALRDLGPDPAEVADGLPKVRLFGPRPHEEYARLLEDVRQHLPLLQNSESLRDDLLNCFAVTIAPLTYARLQVAFAEDGFTQRNARDFLTRLRPVVVELGQGRYRLFHDDFRRYAEERTHASHRQKAHQRLATALEKDWQDEELSAWVEHLWAGEEYRLLAELPDTRKLEEWLIGAPAKSVMDLYRHALAASFHLADEDLIFRTSLAAERAWEAAGEATRPTLRDWSFEVPPRGHDSNALERRAKILKAVAAQYYEDPGLARAIADRFLLRMAFPTRVLNGRKLRGRRRHKKRAAFFVRKHELSTENYLRAHALWLLRDHRLSEAAKMARTRGLGELGIDVWTRAFADETSPEVVGEWAEALVGLHKALNFELGGVALVHLAEDRQATAAAIARVFLVLGGDSTRQSGYALLTLMNQQADWEPVQAGVRWRISHEPIAWRDFFFHGISHVMTGKALELSACSFPQSFASLLNPRGHSQDQVQLGRILWRLGCAAGLARRDLLSPKDLAIALSSLLDGAGTRFAALNSPQTYLPPFALAIRDQPALRNALLSILLAELRPEKIGAGPRTYGLLDALWFIEPEQWRRLARELMELDQFPGTEPGHRIEWRNYWSTRLAVRGVEPTPHFHALMAVVGLGGLRKMDPARLVVELLNRKPLEEVHVQHIQQLVDLLIRLHADPEGRRPAWRHLPAALVLALRLDPMLFEAEFLRVAIEHDAMEAFGDRPASIAARWLAAEPNISLCDLLALWHWIAACPGSFGDDARGPEVGRLIQVRLKELGAEGEANHVARWLPALAMPEQPEAERSTSSSELHQEHHIRDVDLRWFSPWWYYHHEAFNQFIADGGESAWREACQRLASQVPQADRAQLELDGAVADWLIEHRQASLGPTSLEAAFDHLEQQTRFQKQPAERHGTPVTGSTSAAVFVRLLARGLRVSDAEVIRRTLRSLAALARHPATAAQVEGELRLLLVRPDPRIVDMALLALRQVPKLAAETVALIQTLSNHPDAWCRWFACSILGREPTWDPPRQVVGQPGPLAPGIKPKEGRLGAVYVHDDSTVRENSIQRICALSDLDEEEVSRWLNTEHRDIEPLPDLPSGWHHSNGVHRSSSRVAEAARRLASRLASLAPPAVLPALLGTVAGYDPWRAICEPENVPPRGWIELGVEEQLQEKASEWVTLRSLGLTHREDFAAIGQDLYPRLAHIAAEALFPERPTLFAWVAEPWSEMNAPVLRRGPVLPLCFRNRPCPFLRAEFGLVPFWDHPAFNDLTFAVDPVPSWNHPDLGKVVIATVSERPARGFGPEALPFQSTVGWYAHPQWLTRFGHPELSLIRFWRRELLQRSVHEGRKIEFGLEKIDLPGWPQS